MDAGTRIPPDTMGAAGPSHLVEILNSGFGIFNKATGAKITEIPLEDFWASLGNGAGEPAQLVFDPKILYDQYAGRFVAVTLGGQASPDSWILIAVSETSDPTGNWDKWAIDADKDGAVQTDGWADYPGLGIDNGNVYVTANMFYTLELFGTSKIWRIPRAQLLAGSPTLSWTEFGGLAGSVGVEGFGPTMQPAHSFGNVPAEYLVHEGYVITGSPPRRFIRVSSISDSSGGPVFQDLGYIEVAGYPDDFLPGAPQPGSASLIETNDTRLLNAVFRNGFLWTTHHVSNAANTKTEVAWYRVDPADASPLVAPGTPLEQGRISDPNRSYYFPSLAVNAVGDVALGFSGSSTTEYASAFYTGRAAGAPPGSMQPVALLKGGGAPYVRDFGTGRSRWGDFSATCVDPSDNVLFWTLQEFAATPADTWGTWWGSFSITTPAPAPPTITTGGSLPPGTVGNPYNQTLTATGGATPYVWSVAPGSSPPPGLTLGPGGLIGGTPTTAGSYDFTVRVTGGDSLFSEKAFGLTVNPAPAPVGGGGGGGGGCAVAGGGNGASRFPPPDCLFLLAPMAVLAARRWRRNRSRGNGPDLAR